MPNETTHYGVRGHNSFTLQQLQVFVGIREVIRTTLFWIDTLDLRYYTVADGDEQPTTAREAGLDVVATQDLPRSAAHPFYARLNQILDQHDFDGFVEGCASGFRLLLIGYFEGLDAVMTPVLGEAPRFLLRVLRSEPL